MTEKKKSVKTVTKADEGEEAKRAEESRPSRGRGSAAPWRGRQAKKPRHRGRRPEGRPAVHKQAAEKRETQERAPSPSHRSLVSAFSLAEDQRPAAQSPRSRVCRRRKPPEASGARPSGSRGPALAPKGASCVPKAFPGAPRRSPPLPGACTRGQARRSGRPALFPRRPKRAVQLSPGAKPGWAEPLLRLGGLLFPLPWPPGLRILLPRLRSSPAARPAPGLRLGAPPPGGAPRSRWSSIRRAMSDRPRHSPGGPGLTPGGPAGRPAEAQVPAKLERPSPRSRGSRFRPW